jgi:hypothetical protein
LLHNCFVGILGVFGTQSKPNVSNITNCFDGSYEGERVQQVQDTSHEKKETLERQDRPPSCIPCDPALLDEAEATLAA